MFETENETISLKRRYKCTSMHGCRCWQTGCTAPPSSAGLPPATPGTQGEIHQHHSHLEKFMISTTCNCNCISSLTYPTAVIKALIHVVRLINRKHTINCNSGKKRPMFKIYLNSLKTKTFNYSGTRCQCQKHYH